MESDRIETNLGPTADMEPELEEAPKKPRRRFVGRRAASQDTQPTDTSNIESSSQLQGSVFTSTIDDLSFQS